MKTIALVIAGGVGSRMHKDIPKQFLTVNEKPIIMYTLEAFQKHPEVDSIAVVCVEGWEHVLKAYARQFGIAKLEYVIPGGDCGQSSIRNGVFELEKHFDSDDIVLVHDAIRPLVSDRIISDCISVAREKGCAITVLPCAEAMHYTDDQVSSTSNIPRENLKRSQTPQGFPLGKLCDFHRRALKEGITNSVASCTLTVELGEPIYFCQGSEKNIKITTVDDLDIFKALLAVEKSER